VYSNFGLLAKSHYVARMPAKRKIEQGFAFLSLDPRARAELYPDSTLQCLLHMQPPKCLRQSFNTKQPFQRSVPIIHSEALLDFSPLSSTKSPV
jgi:hypothetical protein